MFSVGFKLSIEFIFSECVLLSYLKGACQKNIGPIKTVFIMPKNRPAKGNYGIFLTPKGRFEGKKGDAILKAAPPLGTPNVIQAGWSGRRGTDLKNAGPQTCD